MAGYSGLTSWLLKTTTCMERVASEVDGVVYWIPLSKDELMPFLSNHRLVIEVYETAEGMDGDIVVAVNGVPVAKSNKRLLVEKTRKEVRHENE
ncbi:MAG: hypothetical protein QXV75_08640 [Candidatus Bathyarchaeia archaeon]